MALGYLVIHAYADNIAQPVEGAEVEVEFGDQTLHFSTDSFGATTIIPLEAPEIKYSLEPQTSTRPYAVVDVKVSKMGLQPIIIEGAEIFPGITSMLDVILSSQQERNTSIKQIEIPDQVLWGDYPPKIPEDPQISTKVLPAPIIPEYIVVHDGLPTNTTAPNYVVNFIDYIKNVASSEIYSTWPKETIKANVYAIISFTLNRIFTEWYRSRGYDFTITSSTQYDQKFTYGRVIFDTIASVVDEIFAEYIKQPNRIEPLFAQYNDGIKTNNPGWLSQWRSKELGDQGYDALRILRYFYGNSVYLDTAQEIEGAPSSFPGYNLMLDSCGEPVQKMQNEINTISGSYPGIPKIIPADGQYKQNMVTSIKTFQKVFSLPQTGVIDFATWYKISYVFVAVSKMLERQFSS